METRGSSGTPDEVICWDNLQLAGTGFDGFPTSFGTAQMNANQASQPAPFVAVANVLRVGGGGGIASAITNLHAVDGSLVDGRIILP